MNDAMLRLVERFTGRRIVVIGDLVADIFVYGQASRVSREAPVLILEHEADELVLGGAANAAHNIKALGGEPVVVGVIGADPEGDHLLRVFIEKGMDTQFILRDPNRPTTTKKRFEASGLHTTYQQLLRIDRGSREPAGGRLEKELLQELDHAAGMGEVIVASDYGYGVFSEAMITRISAIAESGWCKVMVDSRFRMLQFQGAYLLTPNEPEAGAAAHLEIRNDRDVADAADRLLHGADAEAVAVTRGKKGMYLLPKGRPGQFIPIYGTDEIADVTGAGDTVIATFAMAGACGADLPLAARLATVTAGLAVLKHGTATITQSEIKAALEVNPWVES